MSEKQLTDVELEKTETYQEFMKWLKKKKQSNRLRSWKSQVLGRATRRLVSKYVSEFYGYVEEEKKAFPPPDFSED